MDEEKEAERTVIGLPPVKVPAALAREGSLTGQDLEVMDKLREGNALLIAVSGFSQNVRYLLDEPSINVGRSMKADILLDDPTVSRRHAVFTKVGGTYVLKDLDSLNGTYVNGSRIDSLELHSGDAIMIGRFKMLFYLKDHS
ncbi:MAG: FHA domain-containing protein [Aeriscardovia sp.]|nr:FHA domain-containing protein [Aeriscardovia sp.]MBP5785759.1 FHA domain-containing protein [Aeriscardovia sp.]MBQ1301192.1 FHA domain-containing protein [Aeriscardovia sp.]MBQ1357557.1 FHA domain-containing protein [Aeriscardovia sp.]MBQ1424854.1 FHA domain-containing protein [Aeriscardovia sp.]